MKHIYLITWVMVCSFILSACMEEYSGPVPSKRRVLSSHSNMMGSLTLPRHQNPVKASAAKETKKTEKPLLPSIGIKFTSNNEDCSQMGRTISDWVVRFFEDRVVGAELNESKSVIGNTPRIILQFDFTGYFSESLNAQESFVIQYQVSPHLQEYYMLVLQTGGSLVYSTENGPVSESLKTRYKFQVDQLEDELEDYLTVKMMEEGF